MSKLKIDQETANVFHRTYQPLSNAMDLAHCLKEMLDAEEPPPYHRTGMITLGEELLNQLANVWTTLDPGFTAMGEFPAPQMCDRKKKDAV